MASLALPLLVLLALSSSSHLPIPATAVCATRSSPYQPFFDHYLQAPEVGDDTTDCDDDDDYSPSPSPSPSAPAPASLKPSATTSSPAPKSAAAVPSTIIDFVQAKAAAGVSSVLGGDGDGDGDDGDGESVSGVLDPSLKPICDMVPYPSVCEGNVKAAAPKSLKSVDVRSAFTLMMEAYTDEIREVRDKSRELSTNDLYDDPINSCNRSLGYMLRMSKEMAESFAGDDGGSLKSGMDALVNSLMSCKEKPTAIQSDMARLYNIWDNIEAIFEKLYPALDPSNMFPTNT